MGQAGSRRDPGPGPGPGSRTPGDEWMAGQAGTDEWTQYANAKDAARTLGVDAGNVSRCCREKVSCVGAFTFKYVAPTERRGARVRRTPPFGEYYFRLPTSRDTGEAVTDGITRAAKAVTKPMSDG